MRAARSDIDMEDLARRMVELDEPAYDEFARTFGWRFRAFFRKRGLTYTDAEDLAVSCVTDIALKVDQYRPIEDGSFKGWVFTLAHRYLFDWWRGHRTAESLSDTLPADFPADEEPDSDSAHTSAVKDAMAHLSEDDQAIIRLKDMSGEQTYDEVAKALGVRAGTARVRHHRALKRLQVVLEKDERMVSYLKRRGVIITEDSQ
jgi:RNA polymerase sigma-70 factor (ECF subfamily)